MLEITDRSHKPDIDEIKALIANSLFDELYDFTEKNFKPLCDIEYSGDNVLLGWNVRLYKAGRTLCRLYPRNGFFSVLLVVGRKEKERVEELLPTMSVKMRNLYNSTKEGMGQRWLVFDIDNDREMLDNLKELIVIRRGVKCPDNGLK